MELVELLEDVNKILNNSRYNLSDGIYQPSIQRDRRNVYFIYHQNNEKSLIVYEKSQNIRDFEFSESVVNDDYTLIKGPLNFFNNKALGKRFDWINPISRHGYKYTIGLGDRLGIASNAHLKLLKNKDVFPVLAQQSIRELLLSNRTFTEVIQAASWSVFEEGYIGGWGADGDHVKNEYEIDYAIRSGVSMITLDLTENIFVDYLDYSTEALDAEYDKLPQKFRKQIEEEYLNKKMKVNDNYYIEFSKRDLEESVLVFSKGILFVKKINDNFVVPFGIDFEISIDEVSKDTTPMQHYFFANELKKINIKLETLAPKFYGEFQKGIDYIGNIHQFEEEYEKHEAIAEKFDYRLSIHSGSDKLSIYPLIGKVSQTNGWHVKTAGTNWLEALKVIAQVNPQLMLDIYKFSYDNLDDVKEFYKFNAQTNGSAPDPRRLSKKDAEKLLINDDTRQILHTMYGSILRYGENNEYLFRDLFFDVLDKNIDKYELLLNSHLAEHLDLLDGTATTKEEVLMKYEHG